MVVESQVETERRSVKKKYEKRAGAGERQGGRARLIFAQVSAKGSFQIALAIRTVLPKNATFILMFLLHTILSLDYKKQDLPKGHFNWVANFPGGEGGCSHSGH